MSERALTVFDRPLKDLAEEFNYTTPLRRIEIPVALYTQFLKLYDRARDLREKLTMVMDDGEHRLLLQEGRLTTAFNLPHEDFQRAENDQLGAFLKSFNPYSVARRTKEYVSLQPAQVEGFFHVFSAAHNVVHGVFDMFRQSDYLQYQRYLRDELAIKYAGPTSLQEIVGFHFTLARTHKMQTAYLAELGHGRGPSSNLMGM